MKQRSRLALACKIVAAVYFGINALAMVGNTLAMAFEYGVWAVVDMWLVIRLPIQLFGTFVPCLTLWGIGTLLDQQQQNRRELERIAKRLDGEEESVPEEETEALEGFIPLDDVVSLDQPTQEP